MDEERLRTEERNKRISKLSLIVGIACVGVGFCAGAACALYDKKPIYFIYGMMVGAGVSVVPATICTFVNLELIRSYSRRLDEQEGRKL